MDTLSPTERSVRMSRVRSGHTGPEMIVRRLVYSLGYRYRLHCPELPGKPDLVFRKRSKAIFVHGCFWHAHKGCKLGRMPKTRLEFWRPKLLSNRRRDAKNLRDLAAKGFQVLVVWQCELTDLEKVVYRLQNFLDVT